MQIQKPYSDLKIVVIGCGNWGKNHTRVLHQLGALYGICDLEAEVSQRFSETYEVKQLTLESILNDHQIDGVLIATPATTHFNLAKQCLQAHKHVFVEKPLALCANDARVLVALAEQNQRVLMVGHILQYHAGFKQLKALVQDGTLGKINYLYSNRLNLGKYHSEDNIWWSFAPHDISMILSLIQKMPHTVTAVGGKYLQHTASDITHTHLSFPGGELAHIFVSWLHPYKEQRLVVIGEKAMVIFDDGKPWEEKLQLHPYPTEWVDGLPQPAKTTPKLIPLTPEEPLVSEDSHFLDCIRENRTPVTDGIEGCSVVEILKAAELSIQKNQAVHFQNPVPYLFRGPRNNYFAHDSAHIDQNCNIGNETKIWHHSHIQKGSFIGERCNIGQNVSIGPFVKIGDGCKIQNNVSIYEGVSLENDVFVGPSVTFTNVHNPRAFINRKNEFRPTLVKKGATIGANATIVCGHTIGQYSFIAAGSVVTKDVEPYTLVAGNPAKPIGWVNEAGERVTSDPLTQQVQKDYA
ncbi:MAG: Gfo/Idh/MocA family oxidoreductase [Gammaproteobacteria bacterium]